MCYNEVNDEFHCRNISVLFIISNKLWKWSRLSSKCWVNLKTHMFFSLFDYQFNLLILCSTNKNVYCKSFFYFYEGDNERLESQIWRTKWCKLTLIMFWIAYFKNEFFQKNNKKKPAYECILKVANHMMWHINNWEYYNNTNKKKHSP